MKKVALFLAKGFEEIEAIGTIDILRRAQIDVVTISITDNKTVTGTHNIPVIADKTLNDTDFENFDMIILPGGMPGTTNLGNHQGVNKVIKSFAAEGKLVAAICAAPSVLGQAGLLEGKKATCYPSFEEYMKGAICSTDKVVRDGNVITSRGMGTAIPFALELVSYFQGEEAAKELGASIMFNE